MEKNISYLMKENKIYQYGLAVNNALNSAKTLEDTKNIMKIICTTSQDDMIKMYNPSAPKDLTNYEKALQILLEKAKSYKNLEKCLNE